MGLMVSNLSRSCAPDDVEGERSAWPRIEPAGTTYRSNALLAKQTKRSSVTMAGGRISVGDPESAPAPLEALSVDCECSLPRVSSNNSSRVLCDRRSSMSSASRRAKRASRGLAMEVGAFCTLCTRNVSAAAYFKLPRYTRCRSSVKPRYSGAASAGPHNSRE